MIRFQIPWARKQLFDSDLGERTGGSAPAPPPTTKSPVSGWEGFSAGLGHCSFWVIGRPTWNWEGEANRAAHSSSQGQGLDGWRGGWVCLPSGCPNSRWGVCKAKGSLGTCSFWGALPKEKNQLY